MIDQNEQLPEGTDAIVAGAAVTSDNQEQMIMDEPTPRDRQVDDSRRGRVVDKVRSSGSKLADQAAGKTRGLVGQGLERSSEALASVSKLVGDTAAGIDERLGEEYGNYARRAAGAIEGAANSLAAKSPDELIDDTRDFVKRSPGIALAGAAVVGFVLARLVKTGLDSDNKKA
jgi:ElaB/YqjD/DUF883 family membrane-anchored ribosome-binding protein